jgi:predicted permease
LRRFLVVGEIAATLVILVGAGLLGRSFVQLISTNPGFSPSNLMTVELSPAPPPGEGAAAAAAAARQIRLLEEILERLRALPGVQGVGLAGSLPVAHGDDLANGQFLILNGRKPPANFEEWGQMSHDPSQVGEALYAVAGADYFRTLGIRLIRGRMFGEQDSDDAPHVAIISQALARTRWPNVDPIGQIIDFGNMDGDLRPMTIIGIVGDVRARGLNLPLSPIIYVDYRQRGLNGSSVALMLRSSASTGEIAAAARGIFHELAPDLPIKVSTYAQELGGWLADRRFLLLLVGLFAAVALILAAVGIYGVVAYSVSRRTQEIGIRMALGAQRPDVLRLITFEGARMAALGVGLGIGASIGLTRTMSTLLFGISATDPVTFLGVALLLGGVALLASYLPARRATRVDPLTALRCE